MLLSHSFPHPRASYGFVAGCYPSPCGKPAGALAGTRCSSRDVLRSRQAHEVRKGHAKDSFLVPVSMLREDEPGALASSHGVCWMSTLGPCARAEGERGGTQGRARWRSLLLLRLPRAAGRRLSRGFVQRHVTVLGYCKNEAKTCGLKGRGITNRSISTSTRQLPNALRVRAPLARRSSPGLSGKKPRMQNQLLKKGIHKQGNWDGFGPITHQHKFLGKLLLCCCQQKIEMSFFLEVHLL